MFPYPYAPPGYTVMTSAIQPQPLQQPVQPPSAPPQPPPQFVYAQPVPAPTVPTQNPVQTLPPPPAPMPPPQPFYPVTQYSAPQPQGYPNQTPAQPNPPPQQTYTPPNPPTYHQNPPPPAQSYPPAQPNPRPVIHHSQPVNPSNGGYHRPGPGWEPEQQRQWGHDAGWERGHGTGNNGTGTQEWNRNTQPPNPRIELYPMQTQHRTDFPPLAPPTSRPTYAQQFQPAQRNDQWNTRRTPPNEPVNPRPDGPPGGPVRNHPRQQNPRGSTTRPQNNPPYEKPAAKPTVYRQSVMPYFTTVQGEFTQLCVNTAQEKPCPEPGCKFSHVPKTERPCPAFHTPKEKCPFDTRCLLGHAEAREAVRQSKAFARHKEWQTQVKTNPGTYGETDAAESGTEKTNPPKPMVPAEAVNTAPDNTPIPTTQQIPAVMVTPAAATTPANPVNATHGKPSQAEPTPGTAPPVNFQALVQENSRQGQEDEMRRLALLTQGLQTDMEKLKQTQQEKDNQMRSLQTAMGTLQAENQTLQEENERLQALLAKAPTDGVKTPQCPKTRQHNKKHSQNGSANTSAAANAISNASAADATTAAAASNNDAPGPGMTSYPPGTKILINAEALRKAGKLI
ncbi:hypothetical protein KFL_001740010 [Klebsormidium nitens]|uniref:C3H1-type domain-containing protein n=1 Tax=Klebsormidium nitens TaxID=105231 RepID=A0A1Y1I258_KLENI|nr:hypothetical protein KFL_001740010 [Klebsormidium nitens]|eukprot:GAQ84042.1 hypothetical protein KFL_001740010 [Klebsormidium nitens]